MRDIHFDADFARDFNAASKSWSWASWHQVRAAQEATAQRLLQQVFDPTSHGADAPDDGEDAGGQGPEA
jgi:hypothetical protein